MAQAECVVEKLIENGATKREVRQPRPVARLGASGAESVEVPLDYE